MFCYQCQEAFKGKGCEIQGVCGKTHTVANLQDLLIYTAKGISNIVVKNNLKAENLGDINRSVLDSLFVTITNANFDAQAIKKKIIYLMGVRDKLRQENSCNILHDSATFTLDNSKMESKANIVGVKTTENEDIRSLRELVIYGVKGISAYGIHAYNLGCIDNTIYDFVYRALNSTLDDSLSIDELIALVLETGEHGVKVMALLDKANTSRYGNPEISKVNIGTRNNPAILVSGHDLSDLEQLLEQTKGTGVDVYTHSEMLPAHYYPKFKIYDNFVGNYGGSWWEQITEFEKFNGPILFTTNCIVPPKNEAMIKKIFTSGSAGYPGSVHIEKNIDGKKDFTQIIEMAKKSKPPTQIENGEIVGGFAHSQVLLLADKIVELVKSGTIKKFFVMAGCDGRMKSREYYTEFAEKLPKDAVILTAGCAKYRYNKLNLGDIGGIPRVLDAGQCNDSYSLAVIALKLKEVFELDDINELPIAYNIAWYEQKAVIVLLALLSLGVKNIHLGPTLPAFLSPNVAKVLIDNFGIAGIGNVKDDIEMLMV